MAALNDDMKIYETPEVKLQKPGDHIIALSGQQNVGKTTLFNVLTGMNQHTGNWPGLTVDAAEGRYTFQGKGYVVVDLPGTYSLMTATSEEEIAASFVISGKAECVVVVCDATSLERNLVLPLQIMELTDKVIVAVNLMDEAARHGVTIDFDSLEKILGVPVVGISAGPGWGIKGLMARIEDVVYGHAACRPNRIICDDVPEGVERIRRLRGSSLEESDETAVRLVRRADSIGAQVVHRSGDTPAARRQRTMDQIIMGKGGVPVMLLLLFGVFWLTISGSNVPSDLLQRFFDWAAGVLTSLAVAIGMPEFLKGLLIDGIFTVAGKVISVMLPPMAIFFPCFTLLEDLGYLPRVAFRLDSAFQRCGACGKQALTMCMGFGCNAAAVVGCRIIDSPRERLMAILTNNLVPCNGRFPTLILLITIFFSGTGALGSLGSALLLTVMVLVGVVATFGLSRILNMTILKGQPSSFVLELPPFRKPQIGQVIVRSVIDRTLIVLTRAISAAAPAGAVIWLLANVSVGGASLLSHLVTVLNPVGLFLGMDGIILTGFILGIPANEMVIPVVVMVLTASGTIVNTDDTALIGSLLISAGWTWKTGLCAMLFCLFHWPCATTLLSVKKETGSLKWMGLAFILPTLMGVVVCAVMNLILSAVP